MQIKYLDNFQKRFLIPSLLFILLSSNVLNVSVFAQEENEVEFWAPQVMLEGNDYDLLLIQTSFNSQKINFDVFTNNQEIIEIKERNLSIESGKSHGVVKIHAKKAGDAEIFSVSESKLEAATVTPPSPSINRDTTE